jgi:outer membrane protein OmpA-like peptidoglycan-associated protein
MAVNSFILRAYLPLSLAFLGGDTEGPNRLLAKARRKLKTSLSRDRLDGDLKIQRGCQSLALVLPEHVLFLTEGNQLTPAGFVLLQRVGTFLKTSPFSEIRIVRPVDQSVMTGSPPGQVFQELAISKARATAIVQQLQAAGVDVQKLSAEWGAHVQPVVAKVTPLGRQKNHRLEIVLQR